MEVTLTAALLLAIAAMSWVVAKVFQGGAPGNERSACAEINAAATGHGTERMDRIRSDAICKHMSP
jgi:hypothetical protein